MVLVYDLGLHDGGDTGHYLKEGCRVVAVDANPAMCSMAETRFRDFIQKGQLRILNCGIGENNSLLEFWICEDFSEWSSFNRAAASRNGAKHHSVMVRCIPVTTLIEEFGVPDYMKIDLEGCDWFCIRDINSHIAPKYISIEMDQSGEGGSIRRLLDLGYREFKVICQNNAWRQVTVQNIHFYDKLAARKIIPRCWQKIGRAFYKCSTNRSLGESGPWGEKTSGAWHSADHAFEVSRLLQELDERLGCRGLGGWYDIHAKR
jgi:FkbM family methyltransferase